MKSSRKVALRVRQSPAEGNPPSALDSPRRQENLCGFARTVRSSRETLPVRLSLSLRETQKRIYTQIQQRPFNIDKFTLLLNQNFLVALIVFLESLFNMKT